MSTGRAHTYQFAGILTVVLLVLYWPLFTGQTTLRGETADLLLAVFSHIHEALDQGEWPLWNKYQFQGLPTLYSPLYWNPLILVYAYIFPGPAPALNALFLTILFIAGMGSFKFCQRYVRHEKTALLGGLSYVLAGFFVVQSGSIGILVTAAFLPGLLWLNDRFRVSGKFTFLVWIGLVYYMFITLTSPGFVLWITVVLVDQHIIGRGDLSWRDIALKIAKLTATVLASGLLVWRIYRERWLHHHPTIVEDAGITDPVQSLIEFTSLIFSKTTATPVFRAVMEVNPGFHYYIGIILLILVPVGLLIRRNRRDIRLLTASVCFFVLSLSSAILWGGGPAFAGMSGGAFPATMKILLVLTLLILGLRGIEKSVRDWPYLKYLFLLSSLLFAGAGYYMGSDTRTIPESGVVAWLLQLDLWKSALFLLLAAIACWIRKPVLRFAVLGLIIVADPGLSQYLNQDHNLYQEDPSTAQAVMRFHVKSQPSLEVFQPVGRYSDRDFALGGLERNTGTLTQNLVRDGFWPWLPDSHQSDTLSGYQKATGRYPLFYFSRDTSGRAAPTVTNLDNVVHVRVQRDHRWELSIFHHYEKFLVFNQNYDHNWHAMVDGMRIPIQRTRFARMQIPIPPGIHSVTLEYQHDGLPHIFIVTMGLFVILAIYLIRRKSFPIYIITVGLPPMLVFLLTFAGQSAAPEVDVPATPAPDDTADYSMDYESRAQDWFVRGGQIYPLDSYDGYRSESLSGEAIYSATLQLYRTALRNKTGLHYHFRIKSSGAAEAGVVLKTYSADDESYNIDYIRSLDNGEWKTVEGQFALDTTAGPLIRAEWYIWNHKAQEFLIDDIEIKLNP